ncbi:LANO_0F04962g1_1 [Lachancea nothofagi CBS 11611]|uniref:LANO_0F04962g1_1 n=1 Tax=Lachancea nothofagi CBS 11611 TaxID=1266666 RepID=A0A1G4K7T3_9SACH|nr:LANO_0F04962g1_1 [Lachancea nothofagi CBS 11611]
MRPVNSRFFLKAGWRLYSKSIDKSASFSLANLRIGYASDVKYHPNSDKMYISRIQVSEGTPDDPELIVRQVCSGLREYVPLDELKGRLLVIVDNMKKCKLRGEFSEAMVLCGDDSAQNIVEPCSPVRSSRSLIGKHVVLKGRTNEPTTRRIKASEWQELGSRLSVDAQNRAVFKDPETGQQVPLCVYDGDEEVDIKVGKVTAGTPVR